MTGLELESKGLKFAPPGLGLEVGQTLVNDGKNPDAWRRGESNPDRAAHLKSLAPSWSKDPGMAIAYPGR